MGKIKLLDIEVSNKIAAGEVVERPASVIKELVENSIDAGAKKITVEIKNGGITYMRIADDGCGMERDDAAVAFLRHATSKISGEADLDAIYTLGFRGEALSSIGAVALVELYTKRREDELGTHTVCEGGEIISSEDEGVGNGTVIIVKNLFYNVPARMKFLKRDATEGGYIADIMVRFILAYPEIAFRFINNGKDIYNSPGDGKLINSVYAVYGKDYARSVTEVDFTGEKGIRVHGIIGKSNTARANRNYQSYYVNRRYIKSPLLIRAVEEAYKNRVMIGKFPVAALNIELNPRETDINVHPTKLEIKFSDEGLIYKTVYHAVKDALENVSDIPTIVRKPSVQTAGEAFFKPDTVGKEGQYTIDEAVRKSEAAKTSESERIAPHMTAQTEAAQTTVSPAPNGGASAAVYDSAAAAAAAEAEAERLDLERRLAHMGESSPIVPGEKMLTAEEAKKSIGINNEILEFHSNSYRGKTAQPQAAATAAAAERNVRTDALEEKRAEAAEPPRYSETETAKTAAPSAEQLPHGGTDRAEAPLMPMRVIGQLFNSYILIEREEELLLIDQHAAHERLKLEELKRRTAECDKYAQLMLEPIAVSLTASEYELYIQNAELINSLGFASEEFGSGSVILRSAPGVLGFGEAEDTFLELLTEISHMKNSLITEKRERLMYTIACKAAVKANQKMDYAEMRSLAEAVFGLEGINTCPHGRPITVSLSKKEIEKEFKRIL